MQRILFVCATLTTSFLLLLMVVIAVMGIQFDIGCRDRLKRAADANTIELAKREVGAAHQYMLDNNLTSGYTSIIYRTPDEDIGYWYSNIKASLEELILIKDNATQLEKSNVLMKLRETILDTGGNGVSVTCPQGISLYPYNAIFALVGWFLTILASALWIGAFLTY